MSKYKVQSTHPSLPSNLEEFLQLYESEETIKEFAMDLVRGHYEEKWNEAV